jgi:hypothetical protein
MAVNNHEAKCYKLINPCCTVEHVVTQAMGVMYEARTYN